MEIKDAFQKRTSVRNYTGEEVTEKEIEQLISWAACAPSAGALYPLIYIILRDENQRAAAVSTTFLGARLGNGQTQKWILTAPVLLAICGDLDRVEKKYAAAGLDTMSMLSQDCGAAVEHILLGAISLGLAGCYVTGFCRRRLADILCLPKNLIPLALVPLGHPIKESVPRLRKAQSIYVDRYGNKRD